MYVARDVVTPWVPRVSGIPHGDARDEDRDAGALHLGINDAAGHTEHGHFERAVVACAGSGGGLGSRRITLV